jgi:hypothetical protein
MALDEHTKPVRISAPGLSDCRFIDRLHPPTANLDRKPGWRIVKT